MAHGIPVSTLGSHKCDCPQRVATRLIFQLLMVVGFVHIVDGALVVTSCLFNPCRLVFVSHLHPAVVQQALSAPVRRFADSDRGTRHRTQVPSEAPL